MLLITYGVTIAISLGAVAYEHYYLSRVLEYDSDLTDGVLVAFIPGINLLAAYYAVDNTKYSVALALKDRNELSKCKNCGKLSRKWQRELSHMKNKSEKTCPHCGKGELDTDSVLLQNWQNTHPDCIALDKNHLASHLRTLKEVEKLQREIEEIDTCRKYNGI